MAVSGFRLGYEDSIQNMRQALEYIEKSPKGEWIQYGYSYPYAKASILSDLAGMTYERILLKEEGGKEEIKKATEYFQEALKIAMRYNEKGFKDLVFKCNYYLGFLKQTNGLLSDAKVYLRGALKNKKDDMDVTLLLAWTLLNLENLKEAEPLINSIERGLPELSSAQIARFYLAKGRFLRLKGEINNAIGCLGNSLRFIKEIEERPAEKIIAEALYERGLCKLALNAAKDAAKDFLSALTVLLHRGEKMEAGQTGALKDGIEKLTFKGEKMLAVKILIGISEVYLKMGKLAESENLLTLAEEVPEDGCKIDILFKLIEIKLALNKNDEAQVILRQLRVAKLNEAQRSELTETEIALLFKTDKSELSQVLKSFAAEIEKPSIKKEIGKRFASALRCLMSHKNELSGEDAVYFTGELENLQSNKRLSEKRFREEKELIAGVLNALSKAKALEAELEKSGLTCIKGVTDGVRQLFKELGADKILEMTEEGLKREKGRLQKIIEVLAEGEFAGGEIAMLEKAKADIEIILTERIKEREDAEKREAEKKKEEELKSQEEEAIDDILGKLVKERKWPEDDLSREAIRWCYYNFADREKAEKELLKTESRNTAIVAIVFALNEESKGIIYGVAMQLAFFGVDRKLNLNDIIKLANEMKDSDIKTIPAAKKYLEEFVGKDIKSSSPSILNDTPGDKLEEFLNRYRVSSRRVNDGSIYAPTPY